MLKSIHENTRIEFKELITKDLDIEKEVIAFLNYKDGGYIYIGIDNNNNIIGIDDIDGDILKIKDRINIIFHHQQWGYLM